jgi:hypothetical protein
VRLPLCKTLNDKEREGERERQTDIQREKDEGCVNGVKVLYKSARRLRGWLKVALVEDVFSYFENLSYDVSHNSEVFMTQLRFINCFIQQNDW